MGCGVACDDGTNYPMSCSSDMFRDATKCGTKQSIYNPGMFDQPVVFKNLLRTRAVLSTEDIVENYDGAGKENICLGQTSVGQTADSVFTIIAPRLRP